MTVRKKKIAIQEFPTRDNLVRDSVSSKALQLLGIPRDFWGNTLDDFNFNSDGLKSAVTNYINNPKEMLDDCINITFSGTTGVGKTFLSSVILQALYRRYYSVYFTTFQTIIAKAFKSDYQEEWIKAEFLVIDELGAETNLKSNSEKSVLKEILKVREQKGYPTIICTNLPLNAISSRYGEEINSLITQSLKVEISQEDCRQSVFRGKEAMKILRGEVNGNKVC